MPDKKIICQDCKQEFLFSEGEQEFFARKKFTEPKRCKPCIEKRKTQRDREANRRKGG